MARRFKYRTSTASRVVWRLVALLCVALIVGALFVWWRGGMWSQGALPTHGMTPTVISAGVALFLIYLKSLLDRRR